VAILRRAVRNAAAMMRAASTGEWADSSIPPNSASMFASSFGDASNEGVALAISTVLSCVKALSDDVATVPFLAYTGDRGGPREPLKVQPRIIVEPFGPDLEPEDGIGQLVVSKAMRGNAYMFVVERNRQTSLPDLLTILHPDAVRPVRQKGVKVFKIGGETYGPDEVIHVPGMMLPGSVAGVDILTAQRLNIGLSLKVTEYAEGFFGSGGSPSGVIEVPGAGDRKRARQVRDGWESEHGGVPNAHRPAVLFGGAKWNQLSVTPENAQYLATRTFMREEVCGWFNVPLQRIQAIPDAMPGGTAGLALDASDAQYAKHGLLPLVRGFEVAWRRMIPGGDRTWALFDLDVFLRANALARAQIAQIHRVTAVRTIDEIRGEDLGKAPLPDNQGENPFAPLNSNASPMGGADNQPTPGGEPGPSEGGPA